MSHIMLRAEQDGVVCSGATKGGKRTYALLEERVPKTKSMTKEEALATLARKYFTSHGPATPQDFVWWSGLTVADARHAIEMIKSEFISATIRSKSYLFAVSNKPPKINHHETYLIPAYDEFIISYKDRNAVIDQEHYKKAISENGLFRPVIIIGGQAMGLWRRTLSNDNVVIETELFHRHIRGQKRTFERAAEAYGHFLGKNAELADKGI
jgi:hypothetical protein